MPDTVTADCIRDGTANRVAHAHGYAYADSVANTDTRSFGSGR